MSTAFSHLGQWVKAIYVFPQNKFQSKILGCFILFTTPIYFLYLFYSLSISFITVYNSPPEQTHVWGLHYCLEFYPLFKRPGKSKLSPLDYHMPWNHNEVRSWHLDPVYYRYLAFKIYWERILTFQGGASPGATNAIRVIVATAYPSGWDRSCCSPCCSFVWRCRPRNQR